MSELIRESLTETLDNLNNILFWGNDIEENEKIELANYFADLQTKGKRSYNGTFRIPDIDFENDSRTFTGEKLGHGAMLMHVTAEETFRALNILDIHDDKIDKAYNEASSNFLSNDSITETSGMYCCGTCSVSFWRNLITGGFNNQEARIANGLKTLAQSRNGKGRWRRFPFYYTCLILTELTDFDILDELHYIAPSVKRMYKRLDNTDKYSSRKKEIMKRLLSLF